MPYCAVPKCASSTARLKSQLKIGEKGITFHQFPLGEGKKELLKKWLKKISRKDFVPTKYSKVCSLHFRVEDFQEERKVTDPHQKRKTPRRTLNYGAVPSVFEGYPSYLTDRVTKSPKKKRKSVPKTIAGARRKLREKKEEETLEAETSMF